MINLKNENGKIYCNSREIAEDFEKSHKEVIYAIEGRTTKNGVIKNTGIIKDFELSGKSHLSNYLIQSEYKDSLNRTRREYLLTKDGFILVVMGFTGKKAFKCKIEYIEEFNRLENELNNYIKEENNNLHKDINILEHTYMELTYRNKRSLTENVCYPILNELGVNKKNRFYVHDKIKNIVTGGAYEKIVRVDGFNVPEFREKYLLTAIKFADTNTQYFQSEKISQTDFNV